MNKPSRWLDFTSIFFLSAALLIGSIRLAVTNWTENLDSATYLTVIGLALGLALGYSRFHPRLVAFFASIYTLFFIPWILGTTMPASIAWNERLISLLGRFLLSLEQFFSRKPVEDSILFLTGMLFLFWLLALLSGYHLTRHGRPWVPLGIAAITLLLVEYYVVLYLPASKHSSLFLLGFLLASLLLIANLYFYKSARKWQSSGVLVEAETRYDLVRGAFTAGVIILLVTWNIPTLVRVVTPGTEERARVNAAWDRFASKFQNAVAPLSGPRVVEVSYTGITSTLGTGQPLSDAEVFNAKVSVPSSSSMVYYWRSRSYDNYQNGVWQSTITNRELYTPNSGPLPYADWYGRVESVIQITVKSNLRTIYIPGQPITLSRPSQLVMQRYADKTVEVNSITIDPVIRPGELYETRTSVANPTVQELRNAGIEYPREITDRYLQLPRNLPSRIQTLAEKITSGKTNPYDQAVAITNYLRKEISYVSPIPTPPSGQDAVDWFLFNQKSGFCQYYASAEVLLLRSLGIPARYSVGYAQGEPDETRTQFTVREAESHAWPEVYFPGIGWVEFEPTVVLLPITRTDADLVALNNTNPGDEEDDAERITALDGAAPLPPSSTKPVTKPAIPTKPVTRKVWVYTGGGIALGGLLAGAIYFNRQRIVLAPYLLKRQLNQRHRKIPAWLSRMTSSKEINEANLPQAVPFPVLLKKLLLHYHVKIPAWLSQWVAWNEMDPFERAFSNVGWVISRLGGQDNLALTPTERVKLLVKLLPECDSAAGLLLNEYQASIYSPNPGNLVAARQASRQIRQLGWKSWLKSLFGGPDPKQPAALKR